MIRIKGIKIKKDTVAVILPIIIIILLGIAIANIDKVFPTPSAAAKISDIARRVNFTGKDPSRGTNPNASVTIIEFSDFQCPACTMAVGPVHEVMDYYGDKINFVYKHFPVKEGSLEVAMAAECARDQGRFWDYHDLLFEKQSHFDKNDLLRYAKMIMLDIDEFSTCLLSGEKATKVESDFLEGKAVGIPGTPTFFINDIMIPGVQPFEELKKIIDQELEK